MARCTILKWFGLQKWFDARFLDLCIAHDEAYMKRIWKEKITSDFVLAASIANRGYIVLAFLSFLYTTILGTPFWLYKVIVEKFK